MRNIFLELLRLAAFFASLNLSSKIIIMDAAYCKHFGTEDN
jgi:hypothetical protein